MMQLGGAIVHELRNPFSPSRIMGPFICISDLSKKELTNKNYKFFFFNLNLFYSSVKTIIQYKVL